MLTLFSLRKIFPSELIAFYMIQLKPLIFRDLGLKIGVHVESNSTTKSEVHCIAWVEPFPRKKVKFCSWIKLTH